ncbi:MAG: MobF family relaxase [Burkholderiales bacterium]
MLSISPLGAASSDKASYCQSSASVEGKTEGYYQKTDAPGTWQGNPAMLAALGIKPGAQVTDHEFAALTRGINPSTGEALVQGAGDAHRAGWDLTFSAPKSVSAVWAVADEADRAAIRSAHDRAVAAALAHLQEHAAYARRGKAGAEAEKLQGLIVAAYPHGTTREMDPDLHDHALAMNLAQRSDGTWGGIESKHLYEWKMAAGAIYRAELAEQMELLGFKTEADRDYFKIAGVPDDLCAEWSKRREQIEAALAESGASGAKASEIAALGSRKAKAVDQDPAALRARWVEEAVAHGLTAQVFADRALTPSLEQVEDQDQPEKLEPQEEPLSIYDKLTRSTSTFSEQDLWTSAAIEMQHQGKGHEAVKARVDELLADKEIVRMRNRVTGELRFSTRSMVKIEREMAETAQRMQSLNAHSVSSTTVDKALADFVTSKGFALSEEQQVAVRHITENGSSIALVRGAAGAGKSTMAEAARTAWEAVGYKVRGAALAGKAAEGLEIGSGVKSQTIHSLLTQIESYDEELAKKQEWFDKSSEAFNQSRNPSEKLTAWRDKAKQELDEIKAKKLDEKTVLVVDEAGMVGSRQMSKLLQAVEKSGAKLVLIGHERQLQAVDAGGAFKALQNVAGCVELNEIRRQKESWARQSVEAFSRGEAAQALESFIDKEMVTIDETKVNAMNSVVKNWFDGRDPASHNGSIMLASTRADVADLNRLARQKMGPALSGFEAAISNSEGRKLEFQQGDRVLFKKNSAALGVKNGTLGTVSTILIDPDGSYKFRVNLDDGKTVEFSPNSEENQYDAIDHGYALTTHKSQGITVDKAYVLAGGSMQDREITYVQMSRARYETRIFFTKPQIEEMAEMVDGEPTEKMSNFAKNVAEKMAKNGQEVPEYDEASFLSTRDFLNTYSDSRIDKEKNSPLDDLKQIVKQMSQSRQKDTTLDYSIEAEPPPEPDFEQHKQYQEHHQEQESTLT